MEQFADEVEITFIEQSPYVEVVSNELINPQNLFPKDAFKATCNLLLKLII